MNFKKKYPNLLISEYEDFHKKKKGGQIKKLSVDVDSYIYWGEVKAKGSTVTKESSIKIEKTICAEFGCRKILNLTEKLCGKYCINHMQQKQEIFHNGLA